ncbi:MAG: GIY-YIG nuclease family protein [Pseudomonadota bacterium]|nr:GIY-YIG nuclease family protein [Pseudomonadota bacterium]
MKDRRAAITAYKERKSVAGVYALRCAPSGEAWVGETLDIDKVWNRLAFSLRSGSHPRRALQAAWTAHGAAAFAFEALERLPEAPSTYARDAALKERRDFWRDKLAAAPV